MRHPLGTAAIVLAGLALAHADLAAAGAPPERGATSVHARLLPDSAGLWQRIREHAADKQPAPSVEVLSPTSVRVVAAVPEGWETASYTVELHAPDGEWATVATIGVPTSATVSAVLDQLTPDTQYQLRVAATKDPKVFRSPAVPVRTSPAPQAGSTGPAPTASATPGADQGGATPADGSAAPADPPAPAVGKTVVVRAASGTVLVRRPGAAAPVELAAASSIPVDAVVDATHGRVALTSQLPDGTTQVGHFSGGTFRVRQSKARAGLTRILLAGKLDCGPSSHALANAAGKRRKRRQVWGKDSGGAFETNGHDSVATVRGTRWLTRDTCKGTLVRVVQGTVDVRDKHTGRVVRVRAGESHFTPRG